MTMLFRHTNYAALLRPSPMRTAVFRHTKYAALLHFPFFTEATSCSLTLLRPSPMRTAVFETYKESQESASLIQRLPIGA